MPHRDTDGDERYDFVTSSGANDGPYAAGGAVVAPTQVSVDATDETATMEPEPTETGMDDESTDMDDESTVMDDESTEMAGNSSTSLPGFGVAVALAALVAAALVAARRR
jgi:PGF-CTERM protein